MQLAIIGMFVLSVVLGLSLLYRVQLKVFPDYNIIKKLILALVLVEFNVLLKIKLRLMYFCCLM